MPGHNASHPSSQTSLARPATFRHDRAVRCVSVAAVGLSLLSGAASAQAPSAHFGGVQSTMPISFQSYGGIAVDGANLFVSDNQNHQIVEFLPSGKQVTILMGGAQPEYLAVDKAHNLYVAATAPAQVLKLSYVRGVYQSPVPLSYNFTSPWGIAVDSNGAVYVGDHATNVVTKLTPQGSTYAPSTYVGAGVLSSPVQMAFDSKNSLFIADRGHNRITVVTTSGAVIAPIPMMTAPSGVAVDANGNVAVVSNAGLWYEQPVKNGYTPTLIASDFTTPYGVAFDATGTIYVDDYGAKQVVMQTPPTMTPNYGNQTMYSTSAPKTFVFVFDTSTTLQNAGLYYASDPGEGYEYGTQQGNPGNCTGSTNFQAGQSCTANVVFQPLDAGWMAGSVALGGYVLNQNGMDVAVTYATAPVIGNALPLPTIGPTPPHNPCNDALPGRMSPMLCQ